MWMTMDLDQEEGAGGDGIPVYPVIPADFFEVQVVPQDEGNMEMDSMNSQLREELPIKVPDIQVDFAELEFGNQIQNVNEAEEGNSDLEPDENKQPKLHPLLLHNVLRDIFKYLDHESLKISREVHPIWNEEACKSLSKSLTVTFLDDQSIKNYMEDFDPDSNNFPHSRYQFYNVQLVPNNIILKEFFEKFGSRVETLILQLKEIPESGLYPVLESWTPNLVSLWLRTVPSVSVAREVNAEDEAYRGRGRGEVAPRGRLMGTGRGRFRFLDMDEYFRQRADARAAIVGRGFVDDPVAADAPVNQPVPGQVDDGPGYLNLRPVFRRGRELLAHYFRGSEEAEEEDSSNSEEEVQAVAVDSAPETGPDTMPVLTPPIPVKPPPPDPPIDTSNMAFPNIRHLTIGTLTKAGFLVTTPEHMPPVPPPPGGIVPGAAVVGNIRFQVSTTNEFPAPGHALFQSRSSTLVKLLKTLPNLNTVSISNLDELATVGFGSLKIRSFVKFLLGALISAGPFSRISRLNFPIDAPTNTWIQNLYGLPINFLSELSLQISSKDVDSHIVIQLFQTIGENLQTLDLSFTTQSYPYGNSFIRFPVENLTRLKHLKLSRWKWLLRFLARLPNLQSLILEDTNLESTFPINFQSVHGNLTSLKIKYKEDDLEAKLLRDSEIVARLTRAFPNLRVFHCPGASDDSLRLIYSDLPWIEELVIEYGEFTDYGVSGVKLEICKDFQEQFTFYDVNADEFRCDLFVGNLMHLKKLVLSSKHMTDLAVSFGILRCTNLTSLVLKSPQISDFSMEIITKKMGHTLTSFDVNGCPNVSAAGRFIATEYFVGRNFLVPEDIVDEEIEKVERAKRLHKAYDSFQRGVNRKVVTQIGNREGRIRVWREADMVYQLDPPEVFDEQFGGGGGGDWGEDFFRVGVDMEDIELDLGEPDGELAPPLHAGGGDGEVDADAENQQFLDAIIAMDPPML